MCPMWTAGPQVLARRLLLSWVNDPEVGQKQQLALQLYSAL